MREEMEKILPRLYGLLEREIEQYRGLIEELKEESGTLQKDSSDSLLQTVHAIESRRAEILKIHRSIQEAAEQMMAGAPSGSTEKNLEELATVLPLQDRRRMEGYRKTLARLKEEAGQINARNRSFIEEAANYWKGLFSILNQEVAESPVYILDGRKKSPNLPPYSLNRRV